MHGPALRRWTDWGDLPVELRYSPKSLNDVVGKLGPCDRAIQQTQFKGIGV